MLRLALSEYTALPDSVLEISVWAMPNSVSFRYFKTSPEIIQLAVMRHVRLSLSVPPRTVTYNVL